MYLALHGAAGFQESPGFNPAALTTHPELADLMSSFDRMCEATHEYARGQRPLFGYPVDLGAQSDPIGAPEPMSIEAAWSTRTAVLRAPAIRLPIALTSTVHY